MLLEDTRNSQYKLQQNITALTLPFSSQVQMNLMGREGKYGILCLYYSKLRPFKFQ